MTPAADARGGDGLREHLRRAGEHVADRRLPEAEAEVLAALAAAPGEARALKLLALIRFKLGRHAEARAAYQHVLAADPVDPAAHLHLGLIALKLERWDEAAAALAESDRLRGGGDRKIAGYLGYALARLGRHAEAAEAFRTAGQDALAAEMARAASDAAPAEAGAGVARGGEAEGEFAAPSATVAAHLSSFTHAGGTILARAGTVVATPTQPPRSAPPSPHPPAAVSLAGFALGRLLPHVEDAAREWAADGILHLAVPDELHVKGSAVLAASGDAVATPARERRQGRIADHPLGGHRGAFRLFRGPGEVWLSPAAPDRRLLSLTLEDDILYLREERVVAFSGELVWEAGRVPRDGLRLIQFRGAGRVVVDVSADELVALRLGEDRPATVDPARLLGWIGRVVAQGIPDGQDATHVACSGEGVLLISRHGQAGERVHERPQPGDDGPGAPRAGGPVLHR
jgi:uncharacterized protein (AIM24 family)